MRQHIHGATLVHPVMRNGDYRLTTISERLLMRRNMKLKRLLVVLAGLIAVLVVAALIVRAREPYAFEEVSRFARLGPEGEGQSAAQVRQILQQSSTGPVII